MKKKLQLNKKTIANLNASKIVGGGPTTGTTDTTPATIDPRLTCDTSPSANTFCSEMPTGCGDTGGGNQTFEDINTVCVCYISERGGVCNSVDVCG